MKRFLLSLLIATFAACFCRAADELDIQVVFKFADGAISFQRAVNTNIDVVATSPNYADGTVTLTTNPVKIGVGAVTTPRWAYMRALDTNVTHIGTKTGTNAAKAFIQMDSGEVFTGPLSSTNLWGWVSVGTGRLERIIIDD